MKDKYSEWLEIKGANEHNLKNINVKIPHNQITVVTGISGSGKSSLAYDLIFRECQRRYLESISAYARSFMGKSGAAHLEEITGLKPGLAVNQKSIQSSSRSTVGTISAIYDWMRLLFARYGKSHFKLSRALFSFNSSIGACNNCNGLGVTDEIDEKKLIKDESLTIREGAFEMTTPSGYIVYSQVTMDVLDQVCRAEGFNVDIPWNDLTRSQQEVVLFGSDKITVPFGKHTLESRMKWSGITARPREEGYYKGIITIMADILKRDRNKNILRFAKTVECTKCNGDRLNDAALSVTYGGYNIADLSRKNFSELTKVISAIQSRKLSTGENHILETIQKRIKMAVRLGLGHLSCMRRSGNISSGEGQRIKIMSLAAANMKDMIYVFDEPSTGLHQSELAALISVLNEIRDNGNTVIIVEHDPLMIKAADWIIDIGPDAGTNGGNLLFCGSMAEFLKSTIPQSHTLSALKKKPEILTGSPVSKGQIFISKASAHNLKNIDVAFQIGQFNVISGVSGAGKTSLAEYVLLPELNNVKSGNCQFVTADSEISRVIKIDQKPVGRSPRSNAATYTGLMDELRSFFAKTETAKELNLKRGDFSFNNKSGRCETCEGAGVIKLGMHFLNDILLKCPDCMGSRFKPEILKVKWNGYTISELLELTVDELLELYPQKSKGHKILSTLQAVGLGYLSLGQPATTISGGEAQRIKLATELAKTSKKNTLYFLDEPTSGLHAHDVEKLLTVLEGLVRSGNTVIVIEHDPLILQRADWIIELGPAGGELGGKLLYCGNLNNLLKDSKSKTAKAVKGEISVNAKNLQMQKEQDIVFENVVTNNLKGIDVKFKRNSFTVVCGLSGSGKSSLVFDTVFAEGWQRYLENLPSYATGMLASGRGEVERFSGLGAMLAIKQERSRHNRRSTIGTFSGIYDLLRLLYSRAGSISGYMASDFSFNKPQGACLHCKGLGSILSVDENKLITDTDKSIYQGAMDGTKRGKYYGEANGQYIAVLKAVEKKFDLNFARAWKFLSPHEKKLILNGTGVLEYDVEWKFQRGKREGVHKFKTKWKGFIPLLNDEYERVHQKNAAKDLKALISEKTCPDCEGKRLGTRPLMVKVAGLDIAEMCALELDQLQQLFITVPLNIKEKEVWLTISTSINEKLKSLQKAGLGYLSLDRSLHTLSGGEYQRLRIAMQLISNMSGIIYILDEVSRGLHPSERTGLITMIRELIKANNTVIAVEHDPQMIKAADQVIELGPYAGNEGGKIIAQGSPAEILNNEASIIKDYLDTDFKIMPKRTATGEIVIHECFKHNLKIKKLSIPTGMLTGICGVSGSGKSTLCRDVLYASSVDKKPIGCKNIEGLGAFDQVIFKEQKSLAKNLISTPATFLGVMPIIGRLFAKDSGQKAKLFNYAGKEGQCSECKGSGFKRTDLDFAGSIQTICDACDGNRYKDEVLKYKYKDKNIADILKLTITEAIDFFQDPKISFKLNIAKELGLGYIPIGQSSASLSGGEAQRLILTETLQKLKKTDKCLIILDEPAAGLHPKDVEQIALFMRKLSDKHTIIFIEHNQRLLSTADHIITLGPKAGKKGGQVISQK